MAIVSASIDQRAPTEYWPSTGSPPTTVMRIRSSVAVARCNNAAERSALNMGKPFQPLSIAASAVARYSSLFLSRAIGKILRGCEVFWTATAQLLTQLFIHIGIGASSIVSGFEIGNSFGFGIIGLCFRAGPPSHKQFSAILQMPKKPTAPMADGFTTAKIEKQHSRPLRPFRAAVIPTYNT